MLYGAFDTPNRLPITRWSKLDGEVASGNTVIAEIGSLSLELTRLSQLTGDPKYFDAVQRITNVLSDQQMNTKLPGLFPMMVNAREADFTSTTVFSIGAQADSLYEYLPKEYLILGGRLDQYRNMYEKAIAAIKAFILFRPMTPTDEDILFAGTVRSFSTSKLELDPQMQHLTCFAPGMIALASKVFSRPADLEMAARLTNGCLWAGRSTVTGLMPELFHAVKCSGGLEDACPWNEEAWSEDMFRRNTNDYQSGDKWLTKQQRLKVKQERLRLAPGMSAIASRQYFLRPELSESIFVMYRITGDEHWRDEAWRLFQAITKSARTEIAFAGIEDVSSNKTRHIDRMESFWLAETLKYFYLIFSGPEVVSLDEYVFNTEAHPLRRPR
jgi:mannosyl-oligosaccharide alpha-1,2-mannosidase